MTAKNKKTSGNGSLWAAVKKEVSGVGLCGAISGIMTSVGMGVTATGRQSEGFGIMLASAIPFYVGFRLGEKPKEALLKAVCDEVCSMKDARLIDAGRKLVVDFQNSSCLTGLLSGATVVASETGHPMAACALGLLAVLPAIYVGVKGGEIRSTLLAKAPSNNFG
jgi:hypothetical protein